MKKPTFETVVFFIILGWQAGNIAFKLIYHLQANWWYVFTPSIVFFGTIGLFYAIKVLLTQNPQKQ